MKYPQGTCLFWNFVLLSVFLCCVGSEAPETSPTICVIGAGIGGSSASHFLREHFGSNAQIDVYEKSQVGGRLQTVKIQDREYEAGGSIIHPKNHYMVNFTKMLGLRRREGADSGALGLFDGTNMVFSISSAGPLTMAKVLWHYGLSFVYMEDFIAKLLVNFERIYNHQNEGQAFTTPEKLLSSMAPEYVQMLHETISDHLSQREFDRVFIEELVRAGMRTNYGQGEEIKAFAGAVSLAGIQPGLWSVHGGNKRVPEELLKRAEVNVIEAEVSMVRLLPGGEYEVTYAATGEEEAQTRTYDMVVIAVPLEQGHANIRLEGLPSSYVPDSNLAFRRTVATFVRGEMNATRLGVSSTADIPSSLLTTNLDLFFNSIGSHQPVNFQRETSSEEQGVDRTVWKVFSPEPLSNKQLQELFVRVDEMKVVDWLAYPHFSTLEAKQSLPPFKLADGLYYVNAIEWAASAMEMSAIAGRNAALLAINHWEGRHSHVDSPPLVVGAIRDEL